ncbi:MAG: aldo/keto reductase [Gammaproteobacteria bacterium]
MSLSTRPLGSTGIAVSPLGLGTVKFGRNQDVKYPQAFSLPSDREIEKLLGLARDLGVNLLDTAPAYGSSEQRLGRLLETREHWVIGSKVGEEFVSGKSFYDFSAKHTRHSVERSLRNLGTDYLDYVLIHSDGTDMHILQQTEVVACLLQLKEEGKVRAVGMSSKTVDGGQLAAEQLDLVMVAYNPSHQEELPVLDRANDLGKGVVIKKALNSGHLGSGQSQSAAANFEFVFAHPAVDSVIVGTISPEHLQANVAAVSAILA